MDVTGQADEECAVAVVQFLDDPKTKRIVPKAFIRSKDGGIFVPSCVQDVPQDSIDVKWQKSDLDGSDGYYPAKIICLAGSIDAAIASAKNFGIKLTYDNVMNEPFKRNMSSPSTTKDKSGRKSRASRKRSASPPKSTDSKKKKSSKPARDTKPFSQNTSKNPKKREPNNRPAQDPVVLTRLKQALDAAVKTNPVMFEHLSTKPDDGLSIANAEDNDTDVFSEPIIKKVSSTLAKKDSVFSEPIIKKVSSTLAKKDSVFSEPIIKKVSSTLAKKDSAMFKETCIKRDGKTTAESVNVSTAHDTQTENSNRDSDDDLETTVDLGTNTNCTFLTSSDSSSSSDSSNDSDGDSEADPTYDLMELKKKQEKQVHSLKAEVKSLQSQLAIVWAEKKSAIAAIETKVKDLESKFKLCEEELQKEKERNACLQDALVAASRTRTVSRHLQFDRPSPQKKLSINQHEPSPLKLYTSPTKSVGSPLCSSSPWKVTETPTKDEQADVSKLKEAENSKASRDSGHSGKAVRDSSEKKNSGKKYIKNNSKEIDGFCHQILGFLNKTEKPNLDKDGNVELGSNIKLNYKSMIEILKSPKDGPESTARNLTLLAWGTNELSYRSLDGKKSNRYPNAPKKEAATPAKVNTILGAVKASLLKSGNLEGPTMDTTLTCCRKSIGNRFNEAATKVKKSAT